MILESSFPYLIKNKINVGAMYFIYQINRLTTTKVDSTYLVLINQQCTTCMSVARLEHMTIGLIVSALPYRAIQVDNELIIICK